MLIYLTAPKQSLPQAEFLLERLSFVPMQGTIYAAKSLTALKLSADFITDASNFFRSSTTEYLLHALIKI